MIHGHFDYLIDHSRLFQDLSQCAQISINQDEIKGYYYFTFWLQYLIPIFAHLTLSNLPFLHRMPSFISSFLPPWKERAQFWYFSIDYFYRKREKRLIELRSSQYDDGFRLVFLEGFFMGICTNLNMTIFLRRSLETYVCHSFVFT